MISSPGFQVRASAWLRAKTRLVMFCPKTISSDMAALSMPTMSRRAPATISTVRWLVAKAPPRLLLSRLR